MLENNLKRKAWHQYQISFAEGFWFAWYYVDLSGVYNKEVEELTNGNEPGTGRQGAG